MQELLALVNSILLKAQAARSQILARVFTPNADHTIEQQTAAFQQFKAKNNRNLSAVESVISSSLTVRDKILASIEDDKVRAERARQSQQQIRTLEQQYNDWWNSLSAEGKNNVRRWGQGPAAQ